MENQRESLSATATIVRNSLATILIQIIIRVLLIVFATFVTRRLGDAEYGRYSLVTSIIYLFSFPADLGLSLYSIRQIARDRQRASYFTSNAAAIRLVVAFPVAIAATLLAIALGYEPSVVLGVVVASGGFLLLALQASLDTILVGYERLDYSAALNLVGQMLFIGVGMWALSWRNSFLVVIGASFLGVAATAALSLGVAHFRLGKLHLDLVPSEWISLIRAALPIAVLQVFFSITLRADTFMLKQWQGDASVGWYNAAYDVIFGLFIVANGVNMSVFPTVCRIANFQPHTARALGQAAAKYLLLFSLPCALGGVLLAGRLVGFLYGPGFAPTGHLLRLLLCALPLRFLVGLADNLSIIYNRTWYAAAITAGDALLNIALNLLLTPRFGAPAAAGITIVCEGLVLGLLLWVLRDQALLAEVKQVATGLASALGAMAVAIYLLQGWHILPLIGVGALIYGVVLVASQAVRVNEMRRMLRPGRLE